VLRGDPALVVGLGTAGDGRAIGADDSNLVSRIDLLGATGRLLRTLATFAAALLLGKERSDPRVIDEVDGPTEYAKENKVEEDAGEFVSANKRKKKDHCQDQRGRSEMSETKYEAGKTYICGSKMLVGASTMLTVSL